MASLLPTLVNEKRLLDNVKNILVIYRLIGLQHLTTGTQPLQQNVEVSKGIMGALYFTPSTIH